MSEEVLNDPDGAVVGWSRRVDGGRVRYTCCGWVVEEHPEEPGKILVFREDGRATPVTRNNWVEGRAYVERMIEVGVRGDVPVLEDAAVEALSVTEQASPLAAHRAKLLAEIEEIDVRIARLTAVALMETIRAVQALSVDVTCQEDAPPATVRLVVSRRVYDAIEELQK